MRNLIYFVRKQVEKQDAKKVDAMRKERRVRFGRDYENIDIRDNSEYI